MRVQSACGDLITAAVPASEQKELRKMRAERQRRQSQHRAGGGSSRSGGSSARERVALRRAEKSRVASKAVLSPGSIADSSGNGGGSSTRVGPARDSSPLRSMLGSSGRKARRLRGSQESGGGRSGGSESGRSLTQRNRSIGGHRVVYYE